MSEKQWMNYHMKDWDSTDAHDSEAKARISWIIKEKKLHHFPLLDETIFIHKNSFRWTKIHPGGYESKEELVRDWEVFKPDMLFPLRLLIIEIDGDFHRNTEKGAKRTKLRNQYYEYACIKLIIYNTSKDKRYDELGNMTDEELYQDLKSKF